MRLALLGGLALLSGCSRGEAPGSDTAAAGRQDAGLGALVDADVGAGANASANGAPDAGGEPSEATRLLQGFARDGQAAAERLVAACDDRAAYLALRRSATASLSDWRRHLPIAAEASFGPEVAIQEAGGAIGAMDRALLARDCNAVRDAAGTLGGAFRITERALDGRDTSIEAFGQAMSDAAFRLGQAVLESTAYVPDGSDAALADALGFLDFVEGGLRALQRDVSLDVPAGATSDAALAKLRTVQSLSEIADRAAIVRATGVLGSAIRSALQARGTPANLMYHPLRDAPDISALTLPRPAWPVDAAQAELGKKLFFDRRLSHGGVRACAFCHEPAHAYADGLIAPASLDPAASLRRNTPSLLYAPLEAVLTWDGRVRTADRQALMVLHTRAEMGVTDEEIARVVAADASYAAAFGRAFPDGVTPRNVGIVLASFEASEFVPDSAPIDRFARGDASALSTDARAGLDVFAGKGRCARCHVPPLFGGSRPPDFTAPVFAVLGVPSAPGARTLDADVGRGGGDFRVPSVRNVGRTAPYFHHGRYPTLEQVIDFYDRGGGKGLGVDVSNQDPEIRPLNLTHEDKRVLTVFLREALSDPP